MAFIDGKRVLVTGGTGSFGQVFCRTLLSGYKPERVVLFSRDEMKQWSMAPEFAGDARVRFFIGDVRDKDRLHRALDDIDVVVHAAANKIVPTAEYNPFETVKTNVQGAMNVIDAAIDAGVRRVVALSTDKASSPINLYGATKLVSDKLFTSSNAYAGGRVTRFSVVRYGNVMGSRGSVIPFFLREAEAGRPLPITDDRMTRFMIRLEDGVSLVLKAIESMTGGEIFVRRVPSIRVLDIAEAIDPGGQRVNVGIRPGEKLHEQMISSEEAPFTREFPDHFTIHNPIASSVPAVAPRGKPVKEGFSYSSETNSDWMNPEELRELIRARKI